MAGNIAQRNLVIEGGPTGGKRSGMGAHKIGLRLFNENSNASNSSECRENAVRIRYFFDDTHKDSTVRLDRNAAAPKPNPSSLLQNLIRVNFHFSQRVMMNGKNTIPKKFFRVGELHEAKYLRITQTWKNTSFEIFLSCRDT